VKAAIGALLALLVLVIAWPFLTRPVADRDGSASGGDAEPEVTPSRLSAPQLERLAAIETFHKHLDEQIWPKELEAQRHENVVIDLWDALRAAKDPFEPLLEARFEQLVLGGFELPAVNELEIVERESRAPGTAIDRAEWQRRLRAWRADGYQLAQSEWRQPAFRIDAAAGDARSTILFTAHVNHRARQERWILHGPIEITWQRSQPGDTNPPLALRIDATHLRLSARSGTPLFTHALAKRVAGAEETFVDPLLSHDLNGDGRSEVILGTKNAVYWNHGQGQFERGDLCAHWLDGLRTCLLADLAGSGFADLLVATSQGLHRYARQPGGGFVSAPVQAWQSPEPLLNPFVMTAGDIDGDRDLDVWLGQYKLPYVAGQMPTPYHDANDGFPAFLLVNDGQGRFHDATQAANLAAKRFRRTYSASFVDLDGDADQDLVVVSDFAGVDLYFNDGRGRFVDASATQLGETRAFGMAHVIADLNTDARLDLFAVGMNSPVAQRIESLGLASPPRFAEHDRWRQAVAAGNRLYLGAASGFSAAPFSAAVAHTGWSWGASALDFDNDGDLDLYIVNGHKSRRSARDYERQFWTHDIYAATSNHDPVLDYHFRATAQRRYSQGESYGGFEKNRLLLNRGDHGFLEAGYLMGVALELDCRNVLADDLDLDGRVDLVLTSYEVWPRKQQGLHLLQNTGGGQQNPRHWIGFRFREAPGVPSPIGATVLLTSAGKRQVRRLVTGDSYRSQSAPVVHFGLGTRAHVESADVLWPDGGKRVFSNPAIDQYHVVDGPE
jgi:hypothetical protein